MINPLVKAIMPMMPGIKANLVGENNHPGAPPRRSSPNGPLSQ
jgi:hypothetical protein